MSDTINIILEYLRRHHFTKSEAVLREEVTTRVSNGLLPLQLDDDLDLDIKVHLQSVWEKAAGLHQQVLKFTPGKLGIDTEKSAMPLELKQDSQLQPEAEKKEKLHPQTDKLQPALKVVEEPGLFFTNFEVEEQVQPVRPVSSVRSTKPLVIFPPVSVKQLSEQLFSPARAGGLGVFQPGAEMTATSSDLSSDHKIQSFLSTAKSTGVSNNLPLRMDNELATRQDDVPPPVMLESLRGKVDALKQVWCHDRLHLFMFICTFFSLCTR
jgi:hypothetical protein